MLRWLGQTALLTLSSLPWQPTARDQRQFRVLQEFQPKQSIINYNNFDDGK